METWWRGGRVGGEESLFLMDLENPSLLENHNFGEIPHKDSPVK